MSQEESMKEEVKEIKKAKRAKLKCHTHNETQEVVDKEDSVSKRPKHYDKTRYRKRDKTKKAAGPAPFPIPDHIRHQVALSYLHQWKQDREAWSFKKKPQYWLLNNFYNKAQVL